MVKVVHLAQKLQGRVSVPPDKSITHRAVLLAALAKGKSTVRNPLAAEDCLSSLSCVEQLGCKVEKGQGLWTITGPGLWGLKPASSALNCGNSGTTMRLISGILSGQDFKSELRGDASLSKRPMDRIADPLGAMGAKFILTKEKFAPFKIVGRKPLKPIQWKNNVASAQVKSAVLLAGLHAQGETVFEEPSLSRDHSERMLKGCGIPLKTKGCRISVQGPAEPQPMEWVVPADFSSAAFFLVAGLLVEGSDLLLEAVNLNPTRTGLLVLVEEMGASLVIQNRREVGGEPVGDIVVRGRPPLKAATLKKEMVPSLIDEIPIIAVLATQAQGKTVLSGLEELRVKETDRLKAMAINLSNLGARVSETKDGLMIEGPTPLKGGAVNSFLDHRIAMSMAVAGLVAHKPVTIEGSESVAISFPRFWDFLTELVGE